MLTGLAALALLAWLTVLALPWQPHRTRERLEPDAGAAARDGAHDLGDVCVLIPARDEAAVVERTIAALKRQGTGLEAIVVDDQSSDGTAAACERAAAAEQGAPIALRVIAGAPLPPGWAGKLWALEQGLASVDRPYTLLLDADIELAHGVVAALRRRADDGGAALVSVMAELHCATRAEKLLTPAFVFFFKLLYPFALANDPRSGVAAAAGGCMLVRTHALRALGGFAAVRGALIDDCSLARAVKRAGGRTWIGMSHSVRSLRAYGLGDFARMVSRSAFTQLRYSTPLLLATTAAMLVTLIVPPVALAGAVLGLVGVSSAAAPAAAAVAALAWLAMGAAYWPTVRFYGLAPARAATLSVAGVLFLAMTWRSALNYWRGTRATWKNRSYETHDPRAN